MHRKRGKQLPQIVFLGLPTLLFLFVIMIPLVMSIVYSLTDWDGISKSIHFVGLYNFKQILRGQTEFTHAAGFTTGMAVVNTVTTMLIGVGLAALLTTRMPASGLFRAIFFLPNTLGGIFLGYIWRFIFLVGFTYLGKEISLAFFQIEWLASYPTAFAALAVVSTWQGVGYVMVIMIAALVGVPADLCESGRLDGASSWNIFFKIKLPCCMPYLKVCFFWTLAQSFKMFDLNTSLTGGGPYGTTASMALQIYRDAFSSNQYGLANAEGLIFFLFIFTITSLQFYLSRKKEASLS